jgi:hypothetical protein
MEQEIFWSFILKVRERLTILLEHNLRNHIPLEEIDEQVLLEMYSWYLRTDLFHPDVNFPTEEAIQTKLTDNVAYFEKWINI